MGGYTDVTINPSDFRAHVIVPALEALVGAGITVTKTAADLLMMTAAMETDLGTWLTQVAGPALGVFQEDPSDLTDLQQRITPAQRTALAGIMTPQTWEEQIETNLVFAAAVCRLHYWHATSEPMPPDTVAGLWSYYKPFYNSSLGAATMADFVAAIKLTDLQSLP